jgi:hypothetical protein
MSAATVAQLKITLDDVKPVVLRRVEVPFDIRLDRLHLTIQAAMGWTNSHLYEIRAGGVGWSTPYPEADWAGDFIDARKARLGDIIKDIGSKTLKYLYDFGDGWEHTIKVERLIDREPGFLYPRLIEAKGHCPPEDVGGPWGYGEFLEAIADPSHEHHRELKEWFADDFNPHVVDVDCPRRRRAGSALVASTRRQAPPYCLTRGAHRMVTSNPHRPTDEALNREPPSTRKGASSVDDDGD